MQYGSDVMIEWLAAAGIEHVALNPGATLRGLHDSLVRADHPDMVLALHEEIAIGIAHGYAKSAGRPMAAFVHDLVGLQHASMAIFNAWVDRAPMLILGGSGPRVEEDRRPWLDWIHTGLPQGALVRDFVKWDAEPSSMVGVRDALSRGLRMAQTGPRGPVYLSIDAALQEQRIGEDSGTLPPVESPPLVVDLNLVEEVAELARSAARPVIVTDRPLAGGSASSLRRLAESLPAAVVDLGGGCNFPTDHWADQSASVHETLGEADLVLALEVRDVAWAITDTDTGTRGLTPRLAAGTPIVAVGLSELRHRGFLVPESLVPEARYLLGDAGRFAQDLANMLEPSGLEGQPWREELARRHEERRRAAHQQAEGFAGERPIHPAHLARTLWDAVRDGPWQLANGLLGGWPRRLWEITEERQYLGRSGGEGLGYGLPASLGAALANRDSDTLTVNIQADGDLMYTASALWTAAHHQLPLLTVVHNNRTYGKDELHQREMASLRERSPDVVPIGIRLESPHIDFAGLARAQGVEGIGPIDDAAVLGGVLRKAATTVRNERRPVLVDVICGT